MKSTILLATGLSIGLAVAQSPTTWTTITLYSTTTEYVNSTLTSTLYASSSLGSSTVPDPTTPTTTATSSTVLVSTSSSSNASPTMTSTSTQSVPETISTTSMPQTSSSTVLLSTSSSSSTSTAVTSTSTDSVSESVSTTLMSQTRARASATAPFGVSVGILSSLSSTSTTDSSSVSSSSSTFASPSSGSTAPSSAPSMPPPSTPSSSTTITSTTTLPSSTTSTSLPAPSTVFTLDVVRVNNTSDTYEPIIAHNQRFYIGLNTSDTCASVAPSNCTSPVASFTSGNGTISMTARGSTPQTVYIGPVGGLRYTPLGQPNSAPNGSTSTGFSVKGSGVDTLALSNANGAFYACPRPSLGMDVAQVFVGIAKFARDDCWQVNAFGTVL